MADTAQNNRDSSRDRQDNRDNSGGDFDRKRSWRSDRGADGGDFQQRQPKQMKQGALGIKALVPSSIVGAIIGKGGEEMKRIKTESGCHIRLSQNDKYFPNSQERPCYIEGEPAEIVKVLDFLQEKVRSDRAPRGNQTGIDDQRKKQLIIVIGPNAAGACIGRGGENVKRLKTDYNVYVRCMSKEDIIPGLDERTITISGDQDNITKAAKDILDLALTINNGGTDKNLDYDRFTGGTPGAPPGGAQYGGQPQQYNGGNTMGNNQYGAPNQGNYGGNQAYTQPQTNQYGAQPPAQGGYNAPPGGGYGSQPQQFNQQPQQPLQQQQQFTPNQIQQYGQQQPPQYNVPGQVQQYGAPSQQFGAPPAVEQYSNPQQQAQPQLPYTTPGITAPPTPGTNIAVQQYPAQGGYQGQPQGVASQGGQTPNQGSYNQGGNQGAYNQGSYQAYQGANQGGYPGANQGGYQGTTQSTSPGGFQGANPSSQGATQGGYQGATQGGYQGATQGGYQGGNQGGYQGGRGGGNNNRGSFRGRGGRGARGGGK